MNESKIYIQLGDVVKITNPTNEILHDQTFYIDYIDKEKMYIINVNTLDRIKQKIKEDGIIGDGTITKIKIIYRNANSGYARQHKLLPGSWINLHFGGDIPSIIVAKITNLEEDMIEIETLENELLFINFDYKGVPEELPITLIELRNEPENFVKSLVKVSEEIQMIDNENEEKEIQVVDKEIVENEEEYNNNDPIIEENEEDNLEGSYNEEIQSQIHEADDIIIFNKKARIYANELEERDIDSEIYTIEDQLISLQDDLLSSIPTESRTNTVQKNINITLSRYKQLRETFSSFNEYNIITGKIKRTANYKPLTKYFQKFDKQLYWLIPVVGNRKKIYDGETIETTENYKTLNLNEELTEFQNKKQHSNEGILIDETIYNNYNNLVHNYSKPFENIFNAKDVIINKPVNTDMHTMIDNSNYNGTLSSIAVESGTYKYQRFLLDRYTTGLTQHETEPKSTDTNSCQHILSQVVNMTPHDTMDIKSFISMPEPIVRFSKINLPSTNILDRSLLNEIFMQYWKIFKEKITLKKHKINLLESNETIFQKNQNNEYVFPPTIFKDALTQYKLNMTQDELNSMNITQSEIYRQYVDRIIPKTKSIFNMMKEYMTDKLTLHNVIQYLEPFLIYSDDITYSQYNNIKYFITKKIQKHKENFIERRNSFGFLKRNVQNRVKENKIYSLWLLLTLELKFSEEIDYDFIDIGISNKYGIEDHKTLTNGEFYKTMILKDNMSLYTSILSAQNLQLTYPNDFTPFFKNEKDKLKEENKKGDEICQNIIVAKRYENINHMANDNDREIMFDRKYDTTNYNLIDNYEKEVNKMSDEALSTHIKTDLMKNQKLNETNAENLTTDLINGYKKVRTGHYAILENDNKDAKENRYTYYIRTKQGKWEIEEQINKRKTEMVEPTASCNIQELCIISENETTNQLNNELNTPCQEITKTQSELKQALLEKMIDEFDEKYNKSKKEHENELIFKIKNNWLKIPKLSKMRTMVKYKYNNFKYNLSQGDDIKINTIISPYQSMLNIILKLPDIIIKSQYIIKFVKEKTRSMREEYDEEEEVDKVGNYRESKESLDWLYCPITNTRLLPNFRYKMAKLYLEGYNEFIDYINFLKQTSGQLSDDGDWWIEKNTHWRIIEIDLDVDEGFENNHMVTTRAIIEEENGNMITLNKEQKVLSVQNAMIINIINAMAISMGITIEKDKENIINIIDDCVTKYIKSKVVYNNENKGSNKKKKTYDEYFNINLMFFTLSTYLIVVQTMIPPPKTRKTHPGCIRSFTGYPLNADNDNSMIEYVSCIAYDIKTSTSPWNALNRLKQEVINKKIKEVIESYLLKNILIKRLIFQKKQYIVNKALFKTSADILDRLPEEHRIEGWINFLPPLQQFSLKEIDNITDIFKTELTKNLKVGSKEQRNQLLVIESKIIYFSLLLQNKINNVVMGQEALMHSSKGTKYLENACCNDNINNTYKYFKNKDKNIHKYNKTVKELSQILEDITLCTKPSILLSKIDTKNKYPKISNTQNESTIYSAFIHFCRFNYNIAIPTELHPVCHKKPNYNNYSSVDSLFTKIQKIKEDGMEFDLNNFLRLIKTVHKNNAIFIDIEKKNISPLFELIRSIENYINKSETQENIFINLEFIQNIQSVINDAVENVNFINYIDSKEMTPSTNKLNSYLYENIDNMKKELIDFMKYNSQKNNYRTILKQINDYNIWSLETTSYEKMSFYKNYIHNFMRVFPIILKNKQKYVLPSQHYKTFSMFHKSTIGKKVDEYYKDLNQFYNVKEIQNILDTVYSNSEHVLNIIDSICCYQDIEGMSGLFNPETCNLILEYVFMKILYKIQFLCEDELMITYNDFEFDNKMININIDNVSNKEFINLDENTELNIDIIEGNKKDLKEKIASVIITFMNIFSKHKKIIDKSYHDIENYIYNLKEKEKNMITDRQEKLEGEEKDVDALMKAHKLGVWGKGLNKGLTQYVKEDYDDERSFRDTMNEIENKLNNTTGINGNINGGYDINVFEELNNAQDEEDINNEEYDMKLIGDDDEINYNNTNENNYNEYGE
jgi:hypothetical protein